MYINIAILKYNVRKEQRYRMQISDFKNMFFEKKIKNHSFITDSTVCVQQQLEQTL